MSPLALPGPGFDPLEYDSDSYSDQVPYYRYLRRSLNPIYKTPTCLLYFPPLPRPSPLDAANEEALIAYTASRRGTYVYVIDLQLRRTFLSELEERFQGFRQEGWPGRSVVWGLKDGNAECLILGQVQGKEGVLDEFLGLTITSIKLVEEKSTSTGKVRARSPASHWTPLPSSVKGRSRCACIECGGEGVYEDTSARIHECTPSTDSPDDSEGSPPPEKEDSDHELETPSSESSEVATLESGVETPADTELYYSFGESERATPFTDTGGLQRSDRPRRRHLGVLPSPPSSGPFTGLGRGRKRSRDPDFEEQELQGFRDWNNEDRLQLYGFDQLHRPPSDSSRARARSPRKQMARTKRARQHLIVPPQAPTPPSRQQVSHTSRQQLARPRRSAAGDPAPSQHYPQALATPIPQHHTHIHIPRFHGYSSVFKITGITTI